MNVTAAVAIVMPIIMLAVRASPKTIVPTRIKHMLCVFTIPSADI